MDDEDDTRSKEKNESRNEESEVSFSEDHAESMHWSRFKDKEINCEHIFEKKPFLQEIAYGTAQKL